MGKNGKGLNIDKTVKILLDMSDNAQVTFVSRYLFLLKNPYVLKAIGKRLSDKLQRTEIPDTSKSGYKTPQI